MQEIGLGDHNDPARFKIQIEMNKTDIIMEVIFFFFNLKGKKMQIQT